MLSELTPYSQYQSIRHFSSLDAIRCVSIVAVIWHHTMPFEHASAPWMRGFLGVDMFFVLSGFLIVTLLLREKMQHRSISLRKFYMRRVLRIFPPYYGLLLGLFLLYGLAKLTGRELFGAKDYYTLLPFYLTYTSNWIAHHAPNLALTWSLAAEEQFYMFWPPVEKWLHGRRLIALLLVFIAINQVVNFGLLDNWIEQFFSLRTSELNILQITFTPICLGVLLAHMLHHQPSFYWIYRLAGMRISPLVFIAVLGALICLPGPLNGWPRLLIQTCMTLLLAACVIREDHWLRQAMTWKPLVRIGIVSYGMYLYHMWGRHIAIEILESMGLTALAWHFPATLLLTYVIAELSFRYYEAPFLKLKKHFTRTMSRPTQSSSSHVARQPRARIKATADV